MNKKQRTVHSKGASNIKATAPLLSTLMFSGFPNYQSLLTMIGMITFVYRQSAFNYGVFTVMAVFTLEMNYPSEKGNL